MQVRFSFRCNTLLELLGALKDLLHGHGGGEDTCLALNDSLDEVVDVVGELVVGGEELGVPEEAFLVIHLGADGEDRRELERELLGAHGLDLEGVVHRREVQDGAGLAREDPCFLCKLYVFDSSPCDCQVFGCVCYLEHGFSSFLCNEAILRC